MLNLIKKLILVMAFLSLVLILTGCGEQQVSKIGNEEVKKDVNVIKSSQNSSLQSVLVPTSLTELELFTLPESISQELTNMLGFRFGEIAFVDSRNGTRIHMIQDGAKLETAASSAEFKKFTSITITGALGIVEGIQNCNFINFDTRTELICEKGAGQESKTSNEVPDISMDLVELESILKNIVIEKAIGPTDFKIGFILAFNIIDGKGELLKHKDYIRHPSLPQTFPAITNSNTNLWSFITEKVNPCCRDVFINGSWQRVCDRTVPACP